MVDRLEKMKLFCFDINMKPFYRIEAPWKEYW